MVAEIALALEVQLGLAGLVRPHHGVDEPLAPTEPQAMLEESGSQQGQVFKFVPVNKIFFVY